MSIFKRPIRIYRYTCIKICKKCGVMNLSFLSVTYMCKCNKHTCIYNLTKVRPLFTLWHRGSDNSPLLILFSANNIDQSIGYFYATESRLFDDFVIFKNNAVHLKYAI